MTPMDEDRDNRAFYTLNVAPSSTMNQYIRKDKVMSPTYIKNGGPDSFNSLSLGQSEKEE